LASLNCSCMLVCAFFLSCSFTTLADWAGWLSDVSLADLLALAAWSAKSLWSYEGQRDVRRERGVRADGDIAHFSLSCHCVCLRLLVVGV
jgi:hypothetical protein